MLIGSSLLSLSYQISNVSRWINSLFVLLTSLMQRGKLESRRHERVQWFNINITCGNNNGAQIYIAQ